MTDKEIERLHGDHEIFSIAQWRKEFETNETTLPYIDWRADKLFYQEREK